MVQVKYARTEEREGRGRGVLSEAIGDYIVCALVLEFYMVSLIEPSDVVMLDENMTGFTGDS